MIRLGPLSVISQVWLGDSRFGNEMGGKSPGGGPLGGNEGVWREFPSFLSSGVYGILRHQEAKRYTRFSARILTLDPPGPPYTASVHLASVCVVSPGIANTYLVFSSVWVLPGNTSHGYRPL